MASRAEKFFEMENVLSYQFDSGTRIDLKCKLDCVIPSLGLIIDLKSSKDPSPYAWGWSAEEYGYHRQAAIYLDAMEAKYGHPFKFLFGAVRSRKPYEAAAYYLDPDSLNRGRKEYSDLMDEYLDRKSTGDWLSDWQKRARQITVPTRRTS
jgi:exodeoxyribonuclease VIII